MKQVLETAERRLESEVVATHESYCVDRRGYDIVCLHRLNGVVIQPRTLVGVLHALGVTDFYVAPQLEQIIVACRSRKGKEKKDRRRLEGGIAQTVPNEKLNELPGTLHSKSSHDANMSNIIKTPMFIEAREVRSILIPDNLSNYSSLSVTGGTNKEQCIDQNATVLLGTSYGINDTLNKGNAQFVLIVNTTLFDTREPTITNDVFESLRYATNIDAPDVITATSTGTSDMCMLSITNNAFTSKRRMLPDVPIEDCISQTTIMNNISHNNL
ncbi:hypothetical protein GIB67_018520 [Kingdonia uniflora]|uniref:Uncharacterized protein n=1 Tax=Kingdonia uniflora TaxID=39325 RepID=A0A7J7LWA3_9MAGN|nr:hypothetical protein GIB67_018520 [Kingdonia uniflora]